MADITFGTNNHGARGAGDDLALSRLRIDVFEPDFHAGSRRAGGAQPHLRRPKQDDPSLLYYSQDKLSHIFYKQYKPL